MDELSKVLYSAYFIHAAGKSLATGKEIPEWKDMDEKVKEGWRVAAKALIKYIHTDPSSVSRAISNGEL